DGDISVAAFAGGRFGQEVVDRMVDPWLCGVYAGRSEELSFEATQAALATASRKYPSLTQAANSVAPQRPVGDDSYLGISTIVGGIGTLPRALAEAVLAGSPGASVRTGATVTELTRTENGWRLTVSSAAGPEYIAADAV